eukprot:TRINITY_DN5365_c0_g1_i3.p1 TRINITY_DN5365_c0_g1~~TRINITY_DN5365_c0_g1_i3.p1  ORF type:complete len:823 (+),score=145.06 TRINITY_DN5365_c0_g1_i3:244-2712(+)
MTSQPHDQPRWTVEEARQQFVEFINKSPKKEVTTGCFSAFPSKKRPLGYDSWVHFLQEQKEYFVYHHEKNTVSLRDKDSQSEQTAPWSVEEATQQFVNFIKTSSKKEKSTGSFSIFPPEKRPLGYDSWVHFLREQKECFVFHPERNTVSLRNGESYPKSSCQATQSMPSPTSAEVKGSLPAGDLKKRTDRWTVEEAVRQCTEHLKKAAGNERTSGSFSVLPSEKRPLGYDSWGKFLRAQDKIFIYNPNRNTYALKDQAPISESPQLSSNVMNHIPSSTSSLVDAPLNTATESVARYHNQQSTTIRWTVGEAIEQFIELLRKSPTKEVTAGSFSTFSSEKRPLGYESWGDFLREQKSYFIYNYKRNSYVLKEPVSRQRSSPSTTTSTGAPLIPATKPVARDDHKQAIARWTVEEATQQFVELIKKSPTKEVTSGSFSAFPSEKRPVEYDSWGHFLRAQKKYFVYNHDKNTFALRDRDPRLKNPVPLGGGRTLTELNPTLTTSDPSPTGFKQERLKALSEHDKRLLVTEALSLFSEEKKDTLDIGFFSRLACGDLLGRLTWKQFLKSCPEFKVTSVGRVTSVRLLSAEARKVKQTEVGKTEDRTDKMNLQAALAPTSVSTPSLAQCVPATVDSSSSTSAFTTTATALPPSQSAPALVGLSEEKIAYFWDIENCSVPSSMPSYEVVQKVRGLARARNARETEFRCYTDVTRLTEKVRDGLESAGVLLAHVSSRKPGAADFAILAGLDNFSEHVTSPATVVLITGDTDFLQKINILKYRKGYRVVLLHSGHARKDFIQTADECYKWSSFLGVKRQGKKATCLRPTL